MLADATAEQVGAAASSLGGAFEEFGTAIVYNGVGGEDLAELDEDALKDFFLSIVFTRLSRAEGRARKARALIAERVENLWSQSDDESDQSCTSGR